MTKTATMYKPGYEGPQLSGRLTPSEVAALVGRRYELVERIHAALLTAGLDTRSGSDALAIGSGDAAYLVEFADLVGQEKIDEPIPPRFRPSPAQVDDMLAALELLRGLRMTYLRAVFLRALWLFHEANDWNAGWSWAKIGERCGYSDSWAQTAYDAVIVQAARRAGILPMFPAEHAMVLVSARRARAECTFITTAGEPMEMIYDLRFKMPLEIEAAAAVWTPGKPAAKRLLEERKAAMKREHIQGGWYWGKLDAIMLEVIGSAQAAKIAWKADELNVGRRVPRKSKS